MFPRAQRGQAFGWTLTGAMLNYSHVNYRAFRA